MKDRLCVTDAAYLAGLIDCWGCVRINRTSTNASAKGCKRGFAYRLNVSVATTDRDVLEWAISVVDAGKLYPLNRARPYRQAWVWQLWSREGAALLSAVLPFLRVKRAQAENAIQFQQAMRQPGSRGLSDAEWDFREQSYFVSAKLNQRVAA